MTKKLFVVLVVIAAVLVTFSLVVGEKGLRFTNDTQVAEKPAPPGTATFQPLPPKVPTSADKGYAQVRPIPDRGDKPTISYAPSGAVTGVINEPTGKDYCDLYGSAAWYITNYFYGMEWYANYQDPEEFGCVDVWPFEVAVVCFNIHIPDTTMTFDVQGFIFENVGEPDCPFPGDILCETPIYTIADIPGGHWQICLPMSEQCCVNEPYFAGIYLYDDWSGMADRPDPVSEDDVTDECRSYNDWGYGWEDLVVDAGWPGEIMLNTEGWTRPQNTCEIPDTTCLLQHDDGAYWFISGHYVGDGYANYFDPEVECGTPAYPFGIDEVMFYLTDNQPSSGDPPTWPLDVRVTIYDLNGYDPCMAEDVAEEVCSEVFTIQQAEAGALISRTLSSTCCVYDPFLVALTLESGTDFQPNVSYEFTDMADSCQAWALWGDWYNWSEVATIFGFPVGYPVIQARGITQHADCALEECHMQYDHGIAYNIGGLDGWASYFDPAVCGEPTYRFGIDTVAFELGVYYATYPMDVKVAVYGLVAGDSCNGPGAEIYSEVITVDITENTLVELALSDVACVDEPFFVGFEYAGGPGTDLNAMASDTPDTVDYCHSWGLYAGTWYNWYDVWGPDYYPLVGYPIIRAYGKTQHPECPEIECEALTYTHGAPTEYSVRPSPTYARDYLNGRFTAPATCTVGKARLWFWPDGTVGNPDLEVILWEDNPGGGVNGGDVPGAQIASIYVPAPVPEYPDWAEVDFYSMGIGLTPGQEFHCGYTCPNYDPGTPTNQLGLLMDAGGYGSDRTSEWFGEFDFWAAWINIYTGAPDNDAFIEVEVCYDTPDFKLFVTPSHRDVVAGDATSYTVTIEPILGFSDPVDLEVTGLPGTAGTASFTVDPVTPPGTSQLDIVTNGTAEALGNYVLTVTATSGAIVYQKDVTLRILSPFNEEALVNFYHGTQRTTNFGALANGALSDNFMWYGRTGQLYDASLISAVPGDPQGDHIALDVYDCEYLGFIADQPIEMTSDPWCMGDPVYEEEYGEIAYSHFYTTEDVISCEYDSLFVVGISDSCTDFSIKIKIYYNPTEIEIPELWIGVYEDWDVGVGSSSPWKNWGDMDTLHNLMWQYDSSEGDQNIVFGLMKIPFYDEYMYNMTFVANYYEVYPDADYWLFPSCDDLSPLYNLMTTQIYRYPGYYLPDCDNSECDFSQLMVAPPFSLNPGDKHIEIWIDFGRDINEMTWEQWYHRVLRYAGFYRGDVDASDTLDLPCIDISDLVYLINYLYKGGPAPQPFADQGNVDGLGPDCKQMDTNCPKNNVGLNDVLYLINYTYKGGPPPIDYVRFIPQYWSRTSMFLSPFNTWP